MGCGILSSGESDILADETGCYHWPMPTADPTAPIDIARIRAAFPSLASDVIFMENAGGSQVPRLVADRIRDYMLTSYVQLGAPYDLSRLATDIVQQAHDLVEIQMNASPGGRVILGSSCSQLTSMIGTCYGDILEPGDEIVIAQSNHESFVGPWRRLADRGITIRWWNVDREQQACTPEGLASVLSDRTRIVAFPHVSNLLGGINDVAAISAQIHEAGALSVCDGVAFAPHRAIDVQAFDVDWYVYSTYKVYGPHMAAMYGRTEAIESLTGPNHGFIPKDAIPSKFELGGVSHEGCAGLLGVGAYLSYLVGRDTIDRTVVEDAFEIMTLCELPLQEVLLSYLAAHPRVRLVGSPVADRSRVPTISFLHDRMTSAQVSEAVCQRGIGVRHGHMYSRRLCEGLEIDPADGVVRISMVHYNTPEEMDRLLAILDDVM